MPIDPSLTAGFASRSRNPESTIGCKPRLGPLMISDLAVGHRGISTAHKGVSLHIDLYTAPQVSQCSRISKYPRWLRCLCLIFTTTTVSTLFFALAFHPITTGLVFRSSSSSLIVHNEPSVVLCPQSQPLDLGQHNALYHELEAAYRTEDFKTWAYESLSGSIQLP